MMPLMLMLGCVQRPDILPPRPDAIPIVPEGTCAADRGASVACTLDGDTFDISACGEGLGERIRMLGINAPEIAHEDPAQCFGEAAEDALRDKIDGEQIWLTFDFDCADHYGRTLAYVWLLADDAPDEDPFQNALLVNEWMLSEGYARLAPEDWSSQPLAFQDRLSEAEADARDELRGLWDTCEAHP